MNENNPSKSRPPRALIRIALCALLLAVGVFGMMALASMKKPPAEAKITEQAVKVDAMRVAMQNLPVWITGYGQARALKSVTIAPEVSGTVKERHQRLKAGETIGAGEVLFRIDDRNYRSVVSEARAQVDQFGSTIERLRQQLEIDRQRLKTLERNRDLARSEFQRLRDLFEQDKVGTQSSVEGAEKAYNAAVDQLDQLSQATALIPIQIKETESGLASAQARLRLAETNLKRCTVSAPFAGRVKHADVETGQFVAPGQKLVTLADDSVLEIQVPLDSRDARRWLRFKPSKSASKTAWFGDLQPAECRIRWTDGDDGAVWQGRLHRVVRFEEQTRTLTVAVRVEGADATGAADGRLPLVEGMFCEVRIPGRQMNRVARLPRQAVSFSDTVFKAVDGRLKTVPVTVERADGDWAYVSGGLADGDVVILTRLIDPLENALLDVTLKTEKDAS